MNTAESHLPLPQPLHHPDQLVAADRRPVAAGAEELVPRDLDRTPLAFAALFAKIGDDLDHGGPGIIGFMGLGFGEVAVEGFGHG